MNKTDVFNNLLLMFLEGKMYSFEQSLYLNFRPIFRVGFSLNTLFLMYINGY